MKNRKFSDKSHEDRSDCFEGRIPLRKDIVKMRDSFKSLYKEFQELSDNYPSKHITFYCKALCKEYWDDLESIINDIDWDHWPREIDRLKSYERKLESLNLVIKTLK